MFNIAFAGTSFFSVPFFRELYQNPLFNIKFVLTKDIESNKYQRNLFDWLSTDYPDRDFPIYTPKYMHEVDPSIFNGLDAMVVVAYGFKIPATLLATTKWVNVHGSYLPIHRGAAPIQYTVLTQGKGAGLSAILMDQGLDTGDIIAQFGTCNGGEGPCVNFLLEDTFTSLADKLMDIGPKWFSGVLHRYLEGKITPIPQAETGLEPSLAPSIREKNRAIDWFQSADKVRAKIHALATIPCCIIELGIYRIKCLSAVVVNVPDIGEPGVLLNTKQLIIKCGTDAVRITRVIPGSGRPMSDEEFCRGRDLTKVGYIT